MAVGYAGFIRVRASSLLDPNYTDGSWIRQKVAMIPRLKSAEAANLSVGDTDPEALEAWRKCGRTFFYDSGQTVRSVFIVREEITALRDGDVQWVYSTDIGVVFELSEGALGIVKASHHIEALRVSFGDSVDALDLPDRMIEWDWDNELGEEYRTKHEFIDVRSLLGDPPPPVGPAA